MPRNIRLSEKHYAIFDERGGIEWLRKLLDSTPHVAMRKRDEKIKADRKAGMSVKELSAKYDLRASRIYEIIRCLKLTSPHGTNPLSLNLQATLNSSWQPSKTESSN